MSTAEDSTRQEPRACSVASALDVIGERWSLLILREVFFGVPRFDEIQRNTGAPRGLVDRRLKKLVAAGVLERRRYCERPPRFDYLPTEAGRQLRPILSLLNRWGATWAPEAPQTPGIFTHDCGDEVHPYVACETCLRPVTGDDLTYVEPVASST